MSSSLDAQAARYAGRHMRFGWWCLLVFLSLGIALEAMHGFKVGLYLDVSNETRRLMWRLSHAHGVLLAVLQMAFAAAQHHVSGAAGWRRVASPCLMAAGLLLPLGFFLGGIVVSGGDPWLGILLVPVGAVLLFTAVLLTAVGMTRSRP